MPARHAPAPSAWKGPSRTPMRSHDAEPVRMSRLCFGLVLGALALLTLAYPLYQAVSTGGYVYYLNGLDEATYLQYDYSQVVQGLTRSGQYLVTAGHRLGLSGGWMNLLFDATALLAFPLLMLAIFRQFGWDRQAARSGAIGMLVLPMFVTTANPLMTWLRNWNVDSGALYWLNVPELYTPALTRSPEPQFSVLLLAACTLAALKWRRFWPVYAGLPFMYPFVSVPAAFVALACQLRGRWPSVHFALGGPLIVAFLAVAGLTGLYNALFVPEQTRMFLLASHLPLVSFTSLVALGALAALWRHIDGSLRFPALALALAPLAVSNLQLVSGFIVHPDNYEQYAGCFIVALVGVFGLAAHVRLRQAVLLLGALVYVRSAYVTGRVNLANHARLPMTPALAEALREDPAHTVVDDVKIASLLSLVHPRQGSTALAYEKTYVALADRYAPGYRCLKQRILREWPGDAVFQQAFDVLDTGYRYGSQDFPFVHLGRKREFKVLQNVDPTACDQADSQPLRYFLTQPHAR